MAKEDDVALEAMLRTRLSWLEHWRELAHYILPRRFRWLMTPKQQRGQMINTRIIDSTATIAVRTLASGMMSGITSPSRPWFKLKLEGFDLSDDHPVAIWLHEVERRIMLVLHRSNFYNSINTVYEDLSTFGTAAMLVYEDFDDVIRCYNPPVGQYALDNSDRMMVDTFARDFALTPKQITEQFATVPEHVRKLAEKAPSKLNLIRVGHLIRPNDGSLPSRFPWRETYWVRGEDGTLEDNGFFEMPGIFPRWDTTGTDAYGRSPGMDALGDIKQLQQEQKRKAQAIDKMVNPPMVADVQLKNQPASLLPGGVTYVSGLMQSANSGFRPAYEVQPRIQELMLDIQEVQERIRKIFFNDLFLMFQQMQAEPRSATIVDARREEKIVMLGPVLERLDNEALDPVLARVYQIMRRAGLIPDAPAQVSNQPIQIEYVSLLAQAQRAVGTTGIERTLGLAGNLAAVKPDIIDNIDFDFTLREYSDTLGNNPKIMRDPDAVKEDRERREQEKQLAALSEIAPAGADAAKTLSETETGAGQNALQQMLGGGF